MDESTVICVMGPTASGKTALALEIAKHHPCEIISVDSALVYRGMDIGTAKPTAEELAQVPHHLIDILDPTETYSAADFRRDALRLIAEIRARGRIPLLVGGTMLYFRVLREGIAAALPPADAKVRDAINREAARLGWPALHGELARVDPVAAAKIHPQHSQRIQRALEVFRLTGRPMSQLHAEGREQQASGGEGAIEWVQLAVAPAERKVLHARIAARFEAMLAAGFIEEVAALRQRGDLNPDLPSMRAVGYRQVWEYLEGRTSRAEMVERGVIATRQLAKRQLTWLRSWSDLCWFYTDAEQRVMAGGLEVVQTEVATGVSQTAAVLKYLDRISI